DAHTSGSPGSAAVVMACENQARLGRRESSCLVARGRLRTTARVVFSRVRATECGAGRATGYLGPFDTDRKTPMLWMFCVLPRLPKTGMTLFPKARGFAT